MPSGSFLECAVCPCSCGSNCALSHSFSASNERARSLKKRLQQQLPQPSNVSSALAIWPFRLRVRATQRPLYRLMGERDVLFWLRSVYAYHEMGPSGNQPQSGRFGSEGFAATMLHCGNAREANLLYIAWLEARTFIFMMCRSLLRVRAREALRPLSS